jgi:hypothetical protein
MLPGVMRVARLLFCGRIGVERYDPFHYAQLVGGGKPSGQRRSIAGISRKRNLAYPTHSLFP